MRDLPTIIANEKRVSSGYIDCACRDCFDIAIGETDARGRSLALCHECEKAGCSKDGDAECQRSDAYDDTIEEDES